MVCKHGGLQLKIHNDVVEVLRSFILSMRGKVLLEPPLRFAADAEERKQFSEEDAKNLRADLKASLSGISKTIYVDACGTFPNARSIRGLESPADIHARARKRKNDKYGLRIATHLQAQFVVFSFLYNGHLSAESQKFVKLLASRKTKMSSLSGTIGYRSTYNGFVTSLRAHMAFAIARGYSRFLRGSREKASDWFGPDGRYEHRFEENGDCFSGLEILSDYVSLA